MSRAEEILLTVEALLASSEFEVVDVECIGGRRGTTVRVYVDKDGGVSLEDCARLSRAVGDRLDAGELVPGHYVLEVSSPGVDRPLRRPADFARFVGETIDVTTHEKIEGRQHHRGVLSAYDKDGDRITVTEETGGDVTFPRGAVKKAHLKRDPWLGTRDRARGTRGTAPRSAGSGGRPAADRKGDA